MNPLVSVIMPAYNGEKYIKRAIESIISQTYDAWELIIVDDCSSDNTVEIINEFLDTRIKLYKNKENKGISFSTNFGIEKSAGKYVALLDDDDKATPERLELQVRYLEENGDIDVLGGGSVLIDEYDCFIRHDTAPLYNPKIIKAWMHFSNRRFSNGTTMIRKDFMIKNNIWFKEDYYGIQDFKFIADCSKKGKISSIDNTLQMKRIHSGEATDYYCAKYGELRKEKYALLQRESLFDSGFKLSNEELSIINEYLPECPKEVLTVDQTRELIRVFNIILEQANKNNIDYYDELTKVCRNIIIQRSIQPLKYDDLIKFFGETDG